jgi:hypothetical protein
LRARRAQVDLLTGTVKAVRDLLTDEQMRKLPAQITQYLDPRFLALVRDGTGLYVGSGGFSGSFFGGPPGGFEVISIAR